METTYLKYSAINRDNFCLRVAGINLFVRTVDEGITLGMDGMTRTFLTDMESADTQLTVGWQDLTKQLEGQMLFDSGTVWQLHQQQDGRYLFSFRSQVFGEHPYKIALFNADFTKGEIYFHRAYFEEGEAIYPLEYPLDELLITNLLAQHRGVELHASGIVVDGVGLLFVGQSGAGKTTTTRLWQQGGEIQVLSDDRIILRHTDAGFVMYGTPWHGEAQLALAGEAPLKGIFFLKHGSENRLTTFSNTETMARLFACCFPTFYHHAGLGFTLEVIEQISKSVPCYQFDFVPDYRAVDHIKQHLCLGGEGHVKVIC